MGEGGARYEEVRKIVLLYAQSLRKIMLLVTICSEPPWSASLHVLLPLSSSRRTEESAVLRGHVPGMLGYTSGAQVQVRKGSSLSPEIGSSSAPSITAYQLKNIPTLKLLRVPSFWTLPFAPSFPLKGLCAYPNEAYSFQRE